MTKCPWCTAFRRINLVAMSKEFASTVDELLANNAAYAEGFGLSDLEGAPARLTAAPARQTAAPASHIAVPARRIAVVACMDARLSILDILGLAVGDAHVMRNAGGVVTDDVVRSLCLSQRVLGTREIILMQHTDCGLQKLTEEAFLSELEAQLGMRPPWAVEAFVDPNHSVRKSMERLLGSPYIQEKRFIRGFVYDVSTGVLDEVGV